MAPEDENDRPFPAPEQDEGNPPEPEKGSPVPSDLELEELDKEIEAEGNLPMTKTRMVLRPRPMSSLEARSAFIVTKIGSGRTDRFQQP